MLDSIVPAAEAQFHLRSQCFKAYDSRSLGPLICEKSRIQERMILFYRVLSSLQSDVDGKEHPKALLLPFSQIMDNFKQLLKELSM